MTSAKNASTLKDIERKRQCLFCFFLCFRLLAITLDALLSQNSFLVAKVVRFSSVKLHLDDVEENSFSKAFDVANKSLWINIVCGVEIQDVIFILYLAVKLMYIKNG